MDHRFTTDPVKIPWGTDLSGGKKNIKPFGKMAEHLKQPIFQDHFRSMLKVTGKSLCRTDLKKKKKKTYLPR